MSTSKDYKNFILEQLNILDEITCKPMMGEYLLYYKGVLFGGIYDNRLLVKMVSNNKKYNMEESIPYDGAKSMYLVDIDDKNPTTVKSAFNSLIVGFDEVGRDALKFLYELVVYLPFLDKYSLLLSFEVQIL